MLEGEPTAVIPPEPDVVAADRETEAALGEDELPGGRRIDARTAVIVVATAVVVGGAIFALRRRRR